MFLFKLFLSIPLIHCITIKSLYYDSLYNEVQCQTLQSLKPKTPEDHYYFILTSEALDCDLHHEFNIKDLDDFQSYYYSTLIQLKQGNSEQCPKMHQFIAKAGAAKPSLKKVDDNYSTAAQLYYLSLQCSDPLPDIVDALINMQEIYHNAIAILDRENSFISTATFMYSFLSYNFTENPLHPEAKAFLEEHVYQKCILNVLIPQLRVTISNEERYWIEKVLEKTGDLYAVEASGTHLKFTNTAGEKVQIKSVNITLESGEAVKYVATPKSKEYSGYVELPKSTTIFIQFNNYRLTKQINVLQKFHVEELLFSVVQSKSQKANFQFSVEDGELYPATLDVTETSYLHVILKLKEQIQPNQVSIRLIHPKYSYTTTQVLAEYDVNLFKKQSKGNSGIYYGIIDFGDPDHIVPLNGPYKVEVLIAHPQYESKRWTFLQVQAKFQAQSIAINDEYYKLDPIIIHQFAQEQPEVPFMFVTFFIFASVLAFLFYMSMLKKLDLSFEIPSVYVLAFLGLLVAVFAVLVLFWIQLNVIETVTILSILSIPLVFVGNYALLSLRSKDKLKSD